jgi:hypothetical protein
MGLGMRSLSGWFQVARPLICTGEIIPWARSGDDRPDIVPISLENRPCCATRPRAQSLGEDLSSNEGLVVDVLAIRKLS